VTAGLGVGLAKLRTRGVTIFRDTSLSEWAMHVRQTPLVSEIRMLKTADNIPQTSMRPDNKGP